jgi:hypothetical protein
MLSDFANNNLSSLFNQRKFVEATVAQVNKDLNGLYADEIGVDFNSPVSLMDQLVNKLQPVLTELSKRTPEQLSQFVYRADLKEQIFFESVSADPSLDNLAYHIIEREAQKVYLR